VEGTRNNPVITAAKERRTTDYRVRLLRQVAVRMSNKIVRKKGYIQTVTFLNADSGNRVTVYQKVLPEK
jgi:hypothetical protein